MITVCPPHLQAGCSNVLRPQPAHDYPRHSHLINKVAMLLLYCVVFRFNFKLVSQQLLLVKTNISCVTFSPHISIVYLNLWIKSQYF